MFKRSRLAALAAAGLTLAALAPAVFADPTGDQPRARHDDPRWSESDDRRGADPDSRWSDGPSYDHGPRAGGGPMQGRGAMHQRMMQMLQLTPEQRARIQAIHQRHQDRLQDLQAQLRDARGDLETRALRDDGRTGSMVDRIAELQARLTRERLEMMLESSRVLTARQRERMHAARERMRDRMEQRRGAQDRNRDDRGSDRNQDRDDR